MTFDTRVMKALAEPSLDARHISLEYLARLWPLTQPQFVFVLDAVEIIGKAKFGEDWDGGELDSVRWYPDPKTAYKNYWSNSLRSAAGMKMAPTVASLSDMARKSRPETTEGFNDRKTALVVDGRQQLETVPDYVEAKQQRWLSNNEASDRLFSAIQWLGDKCRAGFIEGVFQYKGWPKMYEMDAYLWNGPSDVERWAKNGGYPVWVNKVKYDTLLFVRRDQLQCEIAALEYGPLLVETADLSRLAPDLQLAVRLALENQIFDENNGGLKSGQVIEKVIRAAATSGRTIADGRIEEIARLIRFPDAKRSSAGQKSARNKK